MCLAPLHNLTVPPAPTQAKKKRKASRRGKKGKAAGDAEPAEPTDATDSGDTKVKAKKKKKKSRAGGESGKDSEVREVSGDGAAVDKVSKDAEGDAGLPPIARDASGRPLEKVNIATELVPGTAYIRNLPMTANRIELSEVLSKFGTITSCRLVLDKETKALAGTAFCDFAEASSVKKACAAARNKKLVLRGAVLQVSINSIPD